MSGFHTGNLQIVNCESEAQAAGDEVIYEAVFVVKSF
jgi:hypothetical protein